GVRSFAEVFLHIAYGNKLMLTIGTASKEEFQKQVEESAKNETQAMSKAQVIALLTESFAAVKKTFEEVRPQSLNREVDFFGQKATRRGALASLDTHIAEHLGQAIAYARMNGIVPPWSR